MATFGDARWVSDPGARNAVRSMHALGYTSAPGLFMRTRSDEIALTYLMSPTPIFLDFAESRE